jgi:hypothetical protein
LRLQTRPAKSFTQKKGKQNTGEKPMNDFSFSSCIQHTYITWKKEFVLKVDYPMKIFVR